MRGQSRTVVRTTDPGHMVRFCSGAQATGHDDLLRRAWLETCLDGDDAVLCEGTDFEELLVHFLGDGIAVRFRARGTSMHPGVRDGDILRVHPIEHTVVHVGDIVLYCTPHNGIVVHRVVGISTHGEETILLVKGDASGTPDPRVPQSQVLGRVVSIERRGRTIVPRSWTSRYVAPLHARLFRLRRWTYGLLKQAHTGLRKVIATVGSGA